MELIFLVFLSGLETLALAGDGMDQDGTFELPCLLKMPDDRANVVSIYGTCVFQTQVGEHSLRCKNVLDSGFEAVQQVVGRTPQHRGPMEPVLDEAQRPLIPSIGTQASQVFGEPPDRRGVGATVVVDDDNNSQVRLSRYVVQRFPRHSTRQCPVTDHHDHGAFLTTQAKPLGESFSPGQGC